MGRCGWSRPRWRGPGWRRSTGPRTPGGSTRSPPAAASWPMSATIWSTRCSGPPARLAHEVAAIQARREPDIDLVTAAAIRLADGTPATLAISGVSPGPLFALDYFGERGRLRATDAALEEEQPGAPMRAGRLAPDAADHRRRLRRRPAAGSPLCCPAEQASTPSVCSKRSHGPPRPGRSCGSSDPSKQGTRTRAPPRRRCLDPCRTPASTAGPVPTAADPQRHFQGPPVGVPTISVTGRWPEHPRTARLVIAAEPPTPRARIPLIRYLTMMPPVDYALWLCPRLFRVHQGAGQPSATASQGAIPENSLGLRTDPMIDCLEARHLCRPCRRRCPWDAARPYAPAPPFDRHPDEATKTSTRKIDDERGPRRRLRRRRRGLRRRR